MFARKVAHKTVFGRAFSTAFTMSSRQAMTAPYTRAVVAAMRKLYPEVLADKSFDNTGLLLEAPFDPLRRQMNSVLLTVDLTKAVADEAIARQDSIVIAYHPIIFRGLKSLTFADTQQTSLLRLAAEGISVYSPHTAIDCAPGGLGDWLADIVTGTPTDADSALNHNEQQQQQANGRSLSPSKDKPQPVTSSNANTPAAREPSDPFLGEPKRPIYMLQHHPSQLSLNEKALSLGSGSHKRYAILPSPAAITASHPGAGMGRIIRFSSPIPLPQIIDRIGLGLGNPKGFPIAVPQGKSAGDMMIRSIAICAGSGGHVFGEMAKKEDVDLLFTGELSHHEALAAIEQGKAVICLFHSNTERGFLHGVLKAQLETTIEEEWERVRNEELRKLGEEEVGEEDGGEAMAEFREALEDVHFDVAVSEVDRDPYGIMISKDEV